MRRVVVTGVGVVSALGHTSEELFDRVARGESGVRPIGHFPAEGFEVKGAAQVGDLGPLGSLSPDTVDEMLARGDRMGVFALLAARRAVAAAYGHEGTLPGFTHENTLQIGMGLASSCTAEIEAEVVPNIVGDGAYDWSSAGHAISERPSPWIWRHLTDEAGRLIACRHGCGELAVHVGACAAAAMAIGDGFRAVRSGRSARALVGGADAMIHPPGVLSFQRLGALSEQDGPPAEACRPFDAKRSGFVIGEGAAMFVLEPLDEAIRRGAMVYGELKGFGTSLDAWRITDPRPDGSGALSAMRGALSDGRVAPDRVSYVQAHGTGTSANDVAESLAITNLFGGAAACPPVSSTKAATGHLVGAAGAIELALSLEALRTKHLPPTLNWQDGGEDCPLDYVPETGRRLRGSFVLSNSFGFGGQNASLLVRSHPRGSRKFVL